MGCIINTNTLQSNAEGPHLSEVGNIENWLVVDVKNRLNFHISCNACHFSKKIGGTVDARYRKLLSGQFPPPLWFFNQLCKDNFFPRHISSLSTPRWWSPPCSWKICKIYCSPGLASTQALHALQGPPSCTRTPHPACTFLRPFSTVLYKTCAAIKIGCYGIKNPPLWAPWLGRGGEEGAGADPRSLYKRLATRNLAPVLSPLPVSHVLAPEDARQPSRP